MMYYKEKRTIIAIVIFMAIAIACALTTPNIWADYTLSGLIPGPGEPGFDSFLYEKAFQYERQFHTFNTAELGLSLDAYLMEEYKPLVIDFFGQSEDFQTFSGMHPLEVIDKYDEYQDIGMFGGVPAAGEAFRYAVLRDRGGSPAEVEVARTQLMRTMEALHIYHAITGTPGVFARGIRRLVPEDPEAPPIPGTLPETTPLFDENGNPLPPVKDCAVWRDDASGLYPDWIWLDNTSRDQLTGYVFALGAVHDVVCDDPSIPDDYKAALVEDARSIGMALMEVAPETGLDLTIRDADGRLTMYHHLNPREIEPGIIVPWWGPKNGFNALLALSTIRVLYHISQDPGIGAFYDSLLTERHYDRIMTNTLDLFLMFFIPPKVKFINVNMAYVAAYNLLRYEGSPERRERFRQIIEDKLWNPYGSRAPSKVGQSFFNFIWAGLYASSTDETAVSSGVETLHGFPEPPYLDPEVINCDEYEIEAHFCKLNDGTYTLLALLPGGNYGDVVAARPIPMNIRPPSNFEWRSDPFRVNGGGSSRLNPGGDFFAAYWIGRYLYRTSNNDDNISPYAIP